MTEPELRLRVGGSWGAKAAERGGLVTLVEGPADAEGRHEDDVLWGVVSSLEQAREIVDAVNAARDAAKRPAVHIEITGFKLREAGVPPGVVLGEVAAWERRTGRRLADGW